MRPLLLLHLLKATTATIRTTNMAWGWGYKPLGKAVKLARDGSKPLYGLHLGYGTVWSVQIRHRYGRRRPRKSMIEGGVDSFLIKLAWVAETVWFWWLHLFRTCQKPLSHYHGGSRSPTRSPRCFARTTEDSNFFSLA
jgi:hypothetical protein